MIDCKLFEKQRHEMVFNQLKARGIKDKRVLDVMQAIPRESFVPEGLQSYAYEDAALPIGYQQTISQPYIIAFMLEQAHIQPTDRVLEIGTGSGYQAVLLAHLAKEVYSIDIIEPLVQKAQDLIVKMNLHNVHLKWKNGIAGWEEKAPFDVILVTAQFPEVPPALIEQLAVGGRLLIPKGTELEQTLVLVKKENKNKITYTSLMDVRFVPLVDQQVGEGR
jgi:protein-L-isoaspartate(D-aspartate) O-methyltransferase